MNLGEIVTSVQRQGGDSSGALITRLDVVRWANDGQLEITKKTECLSAHRQTDSSSDDGTYDLPVDFLMMQRVTYNDVPLIKKLLSDLDAISSYVDTTSADTPRYWYTSDNVLNLYPKPNASGSGNLDIWYVRTPTELVDDNDTPEIPTWMHKEIIQYCKVQAKELDDDQEGQQRAQEAFNRNVGEIDYELNVQPTDSYPAVRCLPGDMG